MTAFSLRIGGRTGELPQTAVDERQVTQVVCIVHRLDVKNDHGLSQHGDDGVKKIFDRFRRNRRRAIIVSFPEEMFGSLDRILECFLIFPY